MIPTARHLSYARGYIGLGMVNEASDELEAIDWDDRMKPEVLINRTEVRTYANRRSLPLAKGSFS